MKGVHRHNHFALLLTIMIIDILTVSKIRLNYQKVYYENTRCRGDRKYWPSCREYRYRNRSSACGAGQKQTQSKITSSWNRYFYGDVSMPETLIDLPKDIDAIIFTLGSDGQGRIGARAIDYGGVRNIYEYSGIRLFVSA